MSNSFAVLYRWLLRPVPFIGIGLAVLFISLATGWPGAVVGAITGWLLAGWPGLVLGLVAGPVVWLILWGIRSYIAARLRFERRYRWVSKLSTEQPCMIASEPTSADLGVALMELDRRGVEARPSLESLLPLLTSPNQNRRGLGMSLLLGLYPSVLARLPSGASNANAPEVWRERLAALDDADEFLK